MLNREFSFRNPIILPGKKKFTIILIGREHLKLLHTGLTLVAAALAQKFHLTGSRKIIRDVNRGCITCKRVAGLSRFITTPGKNVPGGTNVSGNACYMYIWTASEN